MLIENPYPMWEILHRYPDRDLALTCLHGEALRANECEIQSALYNFLKALVEINPSI
jgi:hypothetical protein